MSLITDPRVPLRSLNRFFIGGEWVETQLGFHHRCHRFRPEQLYFTVPEAQAADMDMAIGAPPRVRSRCRGPG